MKILIIDDNPKFAALLSEALKNLGYDVLVYTKSDEVKLELKKAMRLFTEFSPQRTFCDIRWSDDALNTGEGWVFAEAHGKLPKKFRSRLVMMSGVTEEFGEKYLEPKAKAFYAEFVTKERLMKNPRAVIDQPAST